MAFSLRAGLCCLLVLASAHAQACTRVDPADAVLDDLRSLPNLDLPDRPATGTQLTVAPAFDCGAGQQAFMVQASLSGLTYEKDIVYEGTVYPAYRLSRRSPLIIFLHVVDAGGATPVPLRVGQIVRNPGLILSAPGELGHWLQARYYFPGGAMESVPSTYLGTIDIWPEGDPSQRYRHGVTLGFTIPPLTCTLSHATHVLDDVSADELAAAGSDAGESAFDMPLQCPSANVEVSLRMNDASGANGTDGLLAAAAGSTAQGVQIQLLRGGHPVQLGAGWLHGDSSKGSQVIPFSARYRRNADALQPGLIRGEAVLTATYR
ncbi:TPA: fimbrial protein [Stenotrophomonas maltophilia]